MDLRWEASMPWYDTQNKIETIIPGEQSVVFPGRTNRMGGPRRSWRAPHSGANPVAQFFSPPGPSLFSQLFRWHFGASFLADRERPAFASAAGLYYTSVEDLSQFLEVGDPPYGFYYGSSNPPLLEAPYTVRSTGGLVSGWPRFPFNFPPTNVSA